MTNCLFRLNPHGGGVGQHTEHCSRVQEHTEGELRINGHATHHAVFGIAKDRPRGFSCMNVCGLCASKAEKRGAEVTEGIIQ